MHYHLGLVCTCCVNYFITSADAMCWHAHICRSTTGGDNDDNREEEDYKDNDNSDEDKEFIFEEF